MGFKENIFPSDWVNPHPKKEYDLLIVGGGPGGMTGAIAGNNLGATVALVEKEHLGGECLSFGCIPSKALLRASRVAQEIRGAKEFGLEVDGWKVDFRAVMERVHASQEELSRQDRPENFKKKGIDIFLGPGHFVGPTQFEVKGQTITFKKAVIVTGTEPVSLNIPGLDRSDYLTNEEVFYITALPPRLGVIGGGPIGCELSQAFLRFGSKVTLITHGPNLLPRDDILASDRIKGVFEKEGMKIITRSNVIRVEKKGKEKYLYLDTAKEPIVVDSILVGIGRKPVVEGLKLEKAGILFDPKKGIATDAYLQTSNPHIYAAGDVTSPYKFTHVSQELSKLAVLSAINGNREKNTSLIIPRCTYTDPEVAHVGLTEEEAKKQSLSYKTHLVEMATFDRAIVDRQTTGFFKLITQNDQILGATLMAAHAGEMISEITVAMHSSQGLQAILQSIHPFPTQSQIFRTCAEGIK